MLFWPRPASSPVPPVAAGTSASFLGGGGKFLRAGDRSLSSKSTSGAPLTPRGRSVPCSSRGCRHLARRSYEEAAAGSRTNGLPDAQAAAPAPRWMSPVDAAGTLPPLAAFLFVRRRTSLSPPNASHQTVSPEANGKRRSGSGHSAARGPGAGGRRPPMRGSGGSPSS